MRVEVLNTGTELMLGHIVNQHLASLAQAIFPLGLRVERQVCVPDGAAIREALLESFARGAEIVLVTGGLGPTTDDLTRDITAELLGLKLEHDEEILQHIAARFARRMLPMNDRVKLQALRPPEATVLHNPNGTAPGLYFPPLPRPDGARSPHIFLLPGPPRELLPMVRDQVVPMLRKIAPGAGAREMRSYRVTGLGESMVEERVGEDLLALGLEVGYCARPGEVDLRIIGAPEALDPGAALIEARLGAAIFTHDLRSLEEVVVTTLAARAATLATAESCTGGCIAHRLTNVSGSSKIFLAGYVTYANEAKSAALGVAPALLAEHGAVSDPVARAMAEGARRASGAQWAVATTGIAGPDGGTPAKPVGTVFIALARPHGPTLVEHHKFPTDRETFKNLVSQVALDLLLRQFDGRDRRHEPKYSEGDGGCGGAVQS